MSRTATDGMVPWAGFEPATYRLGGGCSIQLSYQGVGSRERVTEGIVSCHGLRAGRASVSGNLSGHPGRLRNGSALPVLSKDQHAVVCGQRQIFRQLQTDASGQVTDIAQIADSHARIALP